MSNNQNITMSHAEQKTKIQEFISAYVSGMEAWKKAGRLIVELVEADPHVYDYITRECPTLTVGVLQTFERIGRGQLLPALAMDSSPGGERLKKCALSVQERYADEPVPLIVQNDDGERDVILVKVRDLTRDQSRQVFAPTGRMHTEGEQWAKVIEHRSKVIPVKAVTMPYTIKGKNAIIGGIEFTAQQLLGIVTQLTK